MIDHNVKHMPVLTGDSHEIHFLCIRITDIIHKAQVAGGCQYTIPGI
jgi:hypothetical protein